MIEQRIHEWWGANFADQRLDSVHPISGSLSNNHIFLLNNTFILKIYNEVDHRFNKEVKMLKQLDGSNIAPKLFIKKKQDPIIGANTSLMSYVGSANLLQLMYLMNDQEKVEFGKKIACSLRKLHQQKSIPIVQQSSAFSRETIKLMKRPQIKRNAPSKIMEFASTFATKIPDTNICGYGVIVHLDFNLANYVINGDNLNLIDFEYSRLDFRWKELQTMIKFCLVGADDLRGKYDFLESCYPNQSLKSLLFSIRDEYPDMFPHSQRLWIEAILLNQILGKFDRAWEPQLQKFIDSATFLFEEVFESKFLDELLV